MDLAITNRSAPHSGQKYSTSELITALRVCNASG